MTIGRLRRKLGEPDPINTVVGSGYRLLVNVRALLRPVRWPWPRKVRTRLTLIYAALFFAAGWALLGLTYGLSPAAFPRARRRS